MFWKANPMNQTLTVISSTCNWNCLPIKASQLLTNNKNANETSFTTPHSFPLHPIKPQSSLCSSDKPEASMAHMCVLDYNPNLKISRWKAFCMKFISVCYSWLSAEELKLVHIQGKCQEKTKTKKHAASNAITESLNHIFHSARLRLPRLTDREDTMGEDCLLIPKTTDLDFCRPFISQAAAKRLLYSYQTKVNE